MNAVAMSDATHRRALVLFPGALGDFICFLPALLALGEAAHVDLLARTEFADLVPPAVNLSSLDRYEIRRLFASGAACEGRACDFFASYATVYSWTGSQASEFIHQLESVSQGRARVFQFRSSDKQMHQEDYYLSCIDGLKLNPRRPTVAPRPQANAWCENFWLRTSLTGRAVLTLAPGSGAVEKNWPANFYRAIAEWWRRATAGAVIVLIGPVEGERGGFDLLLDCCAAARNLSLAQAAALLARSDLYLGNDSGITHLAAAVGVRAVALFGPSDALAWAPRGQKVTVLSRHVDCSPCAVPVMKSCWHRKCLTAFYPMDVTGELEKLPEVATLTRGGPGITV